MPVYCFFEGFGEVFSCLWGDLFALCCEDEFLKSSRVSIGANTLYLCTRLKLLYEHKSSIECPRIRLNFNE